MENANKDEAGRCLGIAETALKAGNPEKARRFAEKSIKLFSTQRAKDFLSTLENSEHESSEANGEGGGEGDGEGVRRRRERSGEGEKSEGEADYTLEQEEAVQRILCCKDYYDILGVSRDASEADLKRHYRKLALQLHPDKNRAPRADDAFKAVSNAYGILNDKEKRSRYDRFGEEGIQSSGRTSHRHGYYAETDAEELFRTFFGANFSFDDNFMSPYDSTRRRRYYYHHGNTRREPVSGWMQLCQMIPILFILSMSIFSTFIFPLLNAPPYHLHRTSSHHIERHTRQHKILYYVTESFTKEFPTAEAIRRLERDVLTDKKYVLREDCYEAKRRLGFFSRRQGQGQGKQRDIPQPCQELDELLNKIKRG